jgi:hypothetical protein
VETPNSAAEIYADLQAMILDKKRIQTLCPVIQRWSHYRRFDIIRPVKFSVGELVTRSYTTIGIAD